MKRVNTDTVWACARCPEKLTMPEFFYPSGWKSLSFAPVWDVTLVPEYSNVILCDKCVAEVNEVIGNHVWTT